VTTNEADREQATGMKELIDSFWRAAAYCLHPKVIGLSLLPLAIGAGLTFGLAYLFWEPAVAGVRDLLQSWSLLDMALQWIESVSGAGLRAFLAPLIVVALALPVVIVISVLLVALLMTPMIVRLVGQRRFPELERKRGASLAASAGWSLLCTLIALVMLLVSLPLWFIPPLILVLPPLIWGWLTYRVMSFDAMAEHASTDERREIMRRQRLPLMAIGVVAGYLGAAPTLVWAIGAAALPLAPLLIPLSVWLYTLIFAFSAAWFAHYCLDALQRLRTESAAASAGPAPAPTINQLPAPTPSPTINQLPAP
jgi:hypothetical protein